MKRIFIMLVAVVMASTHLLAQVPADVKEVMNKCNETMNSPQGVEIDMNMETKVALITMMDMHFVTGKKDGKSKSLASMKLFGQEAQIEHGFDGTQKWSASDDTVIITTTTTRTKGDEDLDLDLDKQFKKAKMKEKGDYYEIDFSDPVDKKSKAKSVTVKISKKNFELKEMKMSVDGAKVIIKVHRVKHGLSDDYFKLDLSKYPHAVVIRR